MENCLLGKSSEATELNGLFTKNSISCPEYEEKYSVLEFNQDLEKRREKYPYTTVLNKETVQQLKTDGLSIIKNSFDPKKIKKLKDKFENLSENKKIISKTKIHSTLKDDVSLINFPEIMEYVCSDTVYDVVSGFYGCVPLFSSCKIHKTIPSGQKDIFGTQFFHFDSNSLCVLKAFLYLEDVSSSHQGPFIYVKGSHLHRFKDWDKQENRPTRWRFYDEQIQNHYSDKITPIFANAGDIIFANTTGFHKAGIISEKNSRHMLTLNFLIHPEFRRSKDKYMPIRSGLISHIPEAYKPLFEATREI